MDIQVLKWNRRAGNESWRRLFLHLDWGEYILFLRFCWKLTRWFLFVLFFFYWGASISSLVCDPLLLRYKSCLCHMASSKTSNILRERAQRLKSKWHWGNDFTTCCWSISMIQSPVSVPPAVITPFSSFSTLSLTDTLLPSLLRLSIHAFGKNLPV